MTNLSTLFPAVNTFTGDAAAYDLRTGKKAWVDGVELTGTGYFPAMMDFSGGGYYSDTYASSGNKIAALVAWKLPSFTGNGRWIMDARGSTGSSTSRASALVVASDNATTEIRGLVNFNSLNDAGAFVCRLWSDVPMDDDEGHVALYQYDGDAGTASLIIDGQAHDNMVAARVAPVTGTLSTSTATVTLNTNVAIADGLDGKIGFFGIRDVGGLSWADFMQSDGSPKNIEATLNAAWGGGAPLFWHESGMMTENKGSAGNMTKNGTITLAAASTWL